MIKYLSIALLIAAIIYFAIRYHKELLKSLRSFLDELRNFFGNLFGNKKKQGASESSGLDPLASPVRLKPFRQYADPFQSGAAANMDNKALLAFTFEAMQAWGRLFGCDRHPDWTPHEYARQLARAQNHINREQATSVCDWVSAAFYSDQPAADCREELQKFWQLMAATAPAAAPEPPLLAPAASG